MTSKRTCVTLGVLIIGLVICEAAVKPQLVSTMDGALMIAPDGSLWAWGGTHRSDATWFGDRKVSEIPQQVGTDHDWYKVAAGFMTALV